MNKIKNRIAIFLAMVFLVPATFLMSVAAESTQNILESGKEVVYYLFYTEDSTLEADKVRLQNQLELSDTQMNSIAEIGLSQHINNRKTIINNNGTSRSAIQAYNASIDALATASCDELEDLLGNKYNEFNVWMNEWWEIEVQRHNNKKITRADVDTLNVWATQYYPNTSGAKEVALPDKYIKFANLGWDNTYNNPPYTVDLEYGSTSISNIRVDEVGPWNENDNYWDEDRRDWDDLDLGIPEAEAAYYDDYNNGKDQFGRTVTNPAGIDLSVTTAKQLGFANTNTSAWIDVAYDDLP